MKGAVGMEFLSLKGLRGGGLRGRGGAPSQGTLEDTLRKSPDTGISLCRSPFVTEGNLVSGGEARIPGTLKDGWRALGTGYFSARGSMKGTLREGSFTGEPKDMFSKARKWASASLGAPVWGEHGWALLFGGLLIR